MRDLGFPITDEIRTADDPYPVSSFQWGAIYSVYWVMGGLSIHGDIYTEWKRQGAEHGSLGYPITDHIEVAGGEAVYFQRGCLWKGSASNGAVVRCKLNLPLLGKPTLVNPDQDDAPTLGGLSWGLKKSIRESIRQLRPNLFTEIWQDRLVLKRVAGVPTEEIPLTLTLAIDKALTEKTQDIQPWYKGPWMPAEGTLNYLVGFYLLPLDGKKLLNRSLYNISFHLPNRNTYVLSSHSIYAKKSWDSFSFIHATDLHVSRRLEGFRGMLKELSKTNRKLVEGANDYKNYNDGLRDLIRYANHLHDIGTIDFILATGDIVDYISEEGNNNPNAGGNFAFFEKLILGQAPSRDGVISEELRVPIFTVLGNHDYRTNPYKLAFDIDIPVLRDRDARVRAFLPHNLTDEDARALQNGWPTVSRDSARRMVDTDTPKYYFRSINSHSSYAIELGPHRIVMIDSRWEVGIPDSDWDAFRAWLKDKFGTLDEDTGMATKGSPNLIGFQDEHLKLVSNALKETGDGLVIVCVHAPPLNPSEIAHYFRETEHPTTDPAEIREFLSRNSDEGTAGWVLTGTPYFKEGGIQEQLDIGIAKGKTEEFLRLCVGVGVPRKVDLVLCGHGHDNVEFRLGWDINKKFLFYTDFYTENPLRYYASRKAGIKEPVHISVEKDAAINARPTQVRDHTTGAFWTEYPLLKVPPYTNPLNSTSDAKAWWNQRRPLIIETASLGPIDHNQRKDKNLNPTLPSPVFQGFRMITVSNNVITKIHNVTLEELHKHNFKMPWEMISPISATLIKR